MTPPVSREQHRTTGCFNFIGSLRFLTNSQKVSEKYSGASQKKTESPAPPLLLNEFSEELKSRLTQQREHGVGSPEPNGFKKNNRLPPSAFSYIIPESSPQDVREWMIEKGFEATTIEACRQRTGEEMFNLTKEFFDGTTVSPSEVRKLISHLNVQKSSCGYKPRDTTLEDLLRRRKLEVDRSLSDEVNSSPEKEVVSPKQAPPPPQQQQDHIQQMIQDKLRTLCAPTPPPKPRLHMTYSSKDDSISVHSKDSEDMVGGSGGNSPTSVSSSFAFGSGSIRSVRGAKGQTTQVESPKLQDIALRVEDESEQTRM